VNQSGTASTEWQYVRQWTGYYTNGPVTDVNSLSIRCNVDGATKSASTQTVAAGSTVGFTAKTSISHPGTLQFYLAKVPSGKTAANWDGSGNVWFKIFGQGPGGLGSSGLTWPSNGIYHLFTFEGNRERGRKLMKLLGATQVTVKLPSSLPSGEYLFRVEHIALHSAGSAGGAQFYISCGQINVTGGGSGSPGPLVAFPGAYKATDPGLMINIYYPVVSSTFS